MSSIFLPNEAATEAFGGILAQITGCRGLITLSGDLGSGKTTLSRGLIRAAGHRGAVKSPTFTLVEPYEIGERHIMHFDLYRLEDPEELEFLGFRDYLEGTALCLIEWPEKGRGVLPVPDLALTLRLAGTGRQLAWQAHTAYGEELRARLCSRFQ